MLKSNQKIRAALTNEKGVSEMAILGGDCNWGRVDVRPNPNR